MSSLPQQAQTNDKRVTDFFDNYFNEKLSFPSNEVDAVVGFFEKRGFEKNAAISTTTTLLNQAKIDQVKIFELLDTLKGLDNIQLSTVVTEVLNYNRLNTSTLGFKVTNNDNTLEKRNVVV
tara:strand:- start:3732 stop:4094 length:363 start_codon:yes stop_codon:yes gene_type:complete